jgi:hypothetical protein
MPRPLGDASPPYTAVEIDRELVRALRPEAARRAMSVQRLAVTLLETIAREHLADAVLDDDQNAR